MRPTATNTVILDDDSDISEDQVTVQKKKEAIPSTSTDRKTFSKSNDIPIGASLTASNFYKEANANEYKKAHALLEMAGEMKEANKIKREKLEILKEQTKSIKNLSQSINALADRFTQPQ